MAPRELIPVAAGTLVLAAGAAVELVAAPDPALGAVDWLVGAAYVLAALRRRRAAPTDTWLGLATAAAWFAATPMDRPADRLPLVAATFVLVHRGFLLHWITRHGVGPLSDPLLRALVAFGYAASLLPGRGGSIATVLVAVALGGALLRPSATRPAHARRAAHEAALLLLLVGGIWLVTALDLAYPSAPVVWLAAALVVAWRLSLAPETPSVDRALGRLAVELGPSDRPATPVLTCLARALADPGLRLARRAPDGDWTDELGHPVPDPRTNARHGTTLVPAPDGGTLVLIHSPAGAGDSELARVAATAAALGLRRAALVAQLRREGEEIQRSAARLDAVDATERRALAEQLRSGPLIRLRALGRTWRESPDDEALADAVERVLAELDRLASGLVPASAGPPVLDATLRRLAASQGVPVAVDLEPALDALSTESAALVYFVVSEALTNIARHSRARQVRVEVSCAAGRLSIRVEDDGIGGATLAVGGGLSGLADRLALAGGTFTVDSPDGGPTRIRAEVALEAAPVEPVETRAGRPGRSAGSGPGAALPQAQANRA